MENEKKAVDMSQEVCTRSMVRNKKPEAERASQNQEYQENKRSEAKKEMHSMVTMGGDLQPGSLADRLLTGLGQPQINP